MWDTFTPLAWLEWLHIRAAGCFEILKEKHSFQKPKGFLSPEGVGLPFTVPCCVTAALLCSATRDSHRLLILEKGSSGCCSVVSVAVGLFARFSSPIWVFNVQNWVGPFISWVANLTAWVKERRNSFSFFSYPSWPTKQLKETSPCHEATCLPPMSWLGRSLCSEHTVGGSGRSSAFWVLVVFETWNTAQYF